MTAEIRARLGLSDTEIFVTPTPVLKYILEMHAISNLRNFNEVDVDNATRIRAELRCRGER